MVNLIKNYLPLRISFAPSSEEEEPEETFIYVKQHISSSPSQNKSNTLFIANAPFYQSIRTQILLQSIFERYGDVESVTVVANPKKKTLIDDEGVAHVNPEEEDNVTVKMFERIMYSLQDEEIVNCSIMNEKEWYDQGRFAHVHFTSNKEMKKAWAALGGSNGNKKKSRDEEIITFKNFEITGLQNLSNKLYKEEKKKLKAAYFSNENDNDDDDFDDSDDDDEKQPSPIDTLIQLHRERVPSRKSLKEACDKIMSTYETQEEEARQKQASASQVDDDGFVTVSYSTAVGDQLEMEEQGILGSTGGAQGQQKKSGLKRGRNRNKRLAGNEEQTNFYRFQTKESRKRKADDIKARFQEDLERVKKMKQDKMFRPF